MLPANGAGQPSADQTLGVASDSIPCACPHGRGLYVREVRNSTADGGGRKHGKPRSVGLEERAVMNLSTMQQVQFGFPRKHLGDISPEFVGDPIELRVLN